MPIEILKNIAIEDVGIVMEYVASNLFNKDELRYYEDKPHKLTTNECLFNIYSLKKITLDELNRDRYFDNKEVKP